MLKVIEFILKSSQEKKLNIDVVDKIACIADVPT